MKIYCRKSLIQKILWTLGLLGNVFNILILNVWICLNVDLNKVNSITTAKFVFELYYIAFLVSIYLYEILFNLKKTKFLKHSFYRSQ